MEWGPGSLDDGHRTECEEVPCKLDGKTARLFLRRTALAKEGGAHTKAPRALEQLTPARHTEKQRRSCGETEVPSRCFKVWHTAHVRNPTLQKQRKEGKTFKVNLSYTTGYEDPGTIRTTANSLNIPFPTCPRQKMPWGDDLPQRTWAGDILGFPGTASVH